MLLSKTALNRPPRILRSENGNSALKKWKFHAHSACSELRKWKFFPMPWTVNLSMIFLHQIGQVCAFLCISMLLCCSRNSTLNSAFVESRNPGGSVMSEQANYYSNTAVHMYYSETCLKRPLPWETTCIKRPQFLAEVPTFQHNWTCHQRPPVLTDHIFVANGVVFQDRFYCTFPSHTLVLNYRNCWNGCFSYV